MTAYTAEPAGLFPALRGLGISHSDKQVDVAAGILAERVVLDRDAGDLHLADGADSPACRTTRPVAPARFDEPTSLLDLHRQETVAVRGTAGRAWLLLVCQECLAAVVRSTLSDGEAPGVGATTTRANESTCLAARTPHRSPGGDRRG